MTEKDVVCLRDHCGRCCAGGCLGCVPPLRLTPEEAAFLRQFTQAPFLPVAGTQGNEQPVYLAEEGTSPESAGSVIAALRQKGLIRIDYDMPLVNYDYGAYANYPIRGSMALTRLGQELVEDMDVLG